MAVVFEDAFTDKQSELISICLELTNESVDKIFAFGFCTAHELTFNAFFVKDGKLLTTNLIGADDDLIGEFLDAGMDILGELQEVCKEYGKPCPCVLKLTYDVKTHAFDAEYDYDAHEDDDDFEPYMSVYEPWRNEVAESLK